MVLVVRFNSSAYDIAGFPNHPPLGNCQKFGPFVISTKEGGKQAYEDYRQGRLA